MNEKQYKIVIVWMFLLWVATVAAGEISSKGQVEWITAFGVAIFVALFVGIFMMIATRGGAR